MKFRDQLKNIGACRDSLDWVGNKTIEQAWKTCKKSEWMIWVLSRTNFDLTDPICDIADSVLHLVPEDKRLACSDAISAARRRANKDELDAAYDSIKADADYCTTAVDVDHGARSADYATYAAACTAAYAAAYAAAYVAAFSVAGANATRYAKNTVMSADAAIYFGYDSAAYRKEEKKQCNILREYFTITQVKKAFKKLVA